MIRISIRMGCLRCGEARLLRFDQTRRALCLVASLAAT
jgi:hypothetical protein